MQNFSSSKIDTSINNFQNYFPRNTNGNIGLPSAPLYINYQTKRLGFNMYNAPYENDIVNDAAVQYYQTKGPYASLTGIAGSKQEQQFKMLFSNTFKNKLNLTLAFNRYSCIGFYKRQQSFTNNFYTTSNYTSKSGRVGYYAFFNFNKVKHSENGGIVNDSLFLENVAVNKMLLPITLSNARREVRYTSGSINPWFRLNKTDSAKLFSHYIDYQFDYSGNYSKYVDGGIITDNYYHTFYHDTVSTKDSTHWRSYGNGLNYTLKINSINTKLKIGAKNEYNQVYQYVDSTFMNNSVNAGLFVDLKKYSGFIKTNYIVNGPNTGDYSIEVSHKYVNNVAYKLFRSPLVFNLKAGIEKRRPDFIYNTWYTNHFAWSNSFVPTEKMQGMFSIGTLDNRFDMGVVVQSINNFIYFDELAIPQQASLTLENVSLFIHKNTLFFKHLGIDVKYCNQMTSYPKIVSVPANIISGSLYFQGWIKKSMLLQVGFSAQYYDKFHGFAYMPATNMYYVQTQKQVGGYPFIDFFLTARIKPVRFFIKIDHVNQGFMGHNYSLTPGYLQNDRAFKFGLNWLFFD